MKSTRRSLLLSMTSAGLIGAGQESALPVIVSHNKYRGQIPASSVANLMKKRNLSRDALMLKLLPAARSAAHPPLSNYFVGAVASGTSGSLYLGQNIEIPGNPLGLAVHAEQSAIANAYMSEESGIDAIAVTAAPCGHCRQFLSEVSLEMSMRVLIGNSPVMLLSELLPHAFGPKDLGLKEGVFPVRQGNYSLSIPSSDELVLAALKAACCSYFPYSKSPSGVALATSTGRVFSGSYIENAAFNPSLPPLQAALAGYYAAGKGAGEIRRAVLVEGGGRAISQEATTRLVLTAIATAARFERLTLGV